MSDLLNPLTRAGFRCYLRISPWLLKWTARLIIASVEPYLHRNFGLRYLPKLWGALLFVTLCRDVDPEPTGLSEMFFVGLITLVAYHTFETVQRPVGSSQPHSYSSGEPWGFWRRCNFQESTVPRYVEPALACLLSLVVWPFDLLLARWLMCAAIGLFLKEQTLLVKRTLRILDSLDAKHEAKQLNAGLTQQQNHPVRQFHRARLPGKNPAQP